MSKGNPRGHTISAGIHGINRKVKNAVREELEYRQRRAQAVSSTRTLADMSEEEIAEIERSTGMKVKR